MDFQSVRQSVGCEPPVTPRRSHFENKDVKDINELVRYLRDELGLAIAPRERTFSPSQFKESLDNGLYERIKYLSFKQPAELDEAIEEYRSELEREVAKFSAQEKTDRLFDKLHDLGWLTKNIIHKHGHTRQPPSTLLNTTSTSRHSMIQRVDSRIAFDAELEPASPRFRQNVDTIRDSKALPEAETASPWSCTSNKSYNRKYTTALDSIPASPTMRKSSHGPMNGPYSNNSSQPTTRYPSFTSTRPSRDTTAATSFADTINLTEDKKPLSPRGSAPSSSFGSTWHTQEMRPLRRKSESTIDTKTCESPPSKRRRSEDNITAKTSHLESHGKPAQHHQIRMLPGSGFGVEYPYSFDNETPFAMSFEKARLRHDASLPERQIAAVKDHNSAKSLLNEHRAISFQQSSPDIWNLDVLNQDDPRLVLSGKMSFNHKSNEKPLLQLSLQPIRKEAKSTRVERHFGWDRVFTVTVPSLTRDVPSHINGERDSLSLVFQDWLLEPKKFLGRTWCVFHTKELDKKVAGKKTRDTSAVREYSFFAICGDGINDPLTHFQFLDWMFPFRANAAQPICKAFARIDLCVSRTSPSIQFKYEQIRFIDDKLANGEPEDETWLDHSFTARPRKKFSVREVMTDGCARMSVGAFKLICKTLNITDRPSTLQGRINGSKGIWYISAPYETSNADDLEVWIEIIRSQIKTKVRSEDTDFRCEIDRWSFDVVEHTGTPKCSQLYKDFLHILEDRHVPRSTLLEMIGEQVQIPVNEWQDAVRDPAKLVLQRYKRDGWLDDKQRSTEPGLPRVAALKVQLLVDEAGFIPEKCVPLAEAVERMQEMHFQEIRSQLRFPCLKSTNVVGIADPLGVLKPGEIHLSLSQPLVHESTDDVFDMFAGSNVLVARSPALRGSDIQKVKCICHPDLAHLKNVVVMPTRGQIPLAAKLQGGDYDGDKFWICADERLVAPFRNAPVLEQRGIECFPIKQEIRTLQDVVDDDKFGTDQHAREWLRLVLPFASREKMLGAVTNYLYDLAYHHNDLWHENVTAIADLHDLIIDDAKNGYHFDARGFATVRRDHDCPELEKLRAAVKYRKNIEDMSFEFNNGKDEKTSLRSVVRSHTKKKYNFVLDDAVFNVINPIIARCLEEFHQSIVATAESMRRDPDLESTLDIVDPCLKNPEMERLTRQLDAVWEEWKRLWSIRKKTQVGQSDFAEALRNCIANYNLIQPTNTDSRFWNYRPGPTAPTVWECFKVAFLARGYYAEKRNRSEPESRRSFMFWIARDTVCYLKSHSASGKKVIDRVKAIKKPKAPKDWTLLGPYDSSSNGAVLGETDDEFGPGFDDEALDDLDQFC